MSKEKNKIIDIEIEIEDSEELEISESEFKKNLDKVVLSDTQHPKDSETS